MKRRPSAPSLNNYLIAAILDGSAVMRSPKELQKEIREMVRDLGKSSSLTTSSSGYGSRRDDDEEHISLPALILFDPPPAYSEKLAAHEAAMKSWEEELRSLEASINAMRIKVQVGSDQALEALVEQADNICRMSLTASSRLLIPEKTK